MDWLCISIHTSAEGIEAVCGRLYAMGYENAEIVDDEAEVRAHLERIRAFWDYVDEEALMGREGPQVRVYVTDNDIGRAQCEEIRASIEALRGEDVGLDLGDLALDVRPVNDADWENNWKRYFKPLPIGRRLLVLPEWERRPETDRLVLTIDPKFLFGTGQHASTRLCLEALEGRVTLGMRVLDIGCGSGILSIAALLMGAREVVAVDIEPNVEETVRENAALNHIPEGLLTVFRGDAVQSQEARARMGAGYDIVVANIVADVILSLVDTAWERLNAGGTFICSGIIDEREADVRAALKARGFAVETIEREGWVCLVAKRKG